MSQQVAPPDQRQADQQKPRARSGKVLYLMCECVCTSMEFRRAVRPASVRTDGLTVTVRPCSPSVWLAGDLPAVNTSSIRCEDDVRVFPEAHKVYFNILKMSVALSNLRSLVFE